MERLTIDGPSFIELSNVFFKEVCFDQLNIEMAAIGNILAHLFMAEIEQNATEIEKNGFKGCFQSEPVIFA